MGKNPYILDKITNEGGITLNLKGQIVVFVEKDEDIFMLSHPKLNIRVWGKTKEEALDAFNFIFYSLYDNIALEQDAKLTTGAIELKNEIISLVKSVDNSLCH